MAGDTPHEAVEHYMRPLQRAVSCVTRAVLNLSPGGRNPSDQPHKLDLGHGAPVPVGGFGLTISQQYRIVEAEGERGPWKVSTAGYFYAIEDEDGREIISYHWHPAGVSWERRPHLHLGAGAHIGFGGLEKAHLPTNRVSVEDFLRLCVRELGVPAIRDDWEEVLGDTQAAFERWQTWPQPGEPS